MHQVLSHRAAPSASPIKLSVHGHFYQPPRENPYTGFIQPEPGAAPYANFNEKITAECYRPLAEAGAFSLMNFNLGPTLAGWLERAHPDVYRHIIEADQQQFQLYGVGNAMAQAYNHTILPLATRRDKHTQIYWGLQDFSHRYGHEAQGMWFAETGVDTETLDIAAQHGVRYTILAPWQVEGQIDPTEPYILRLHSGRSMTVFIYNNLSGGVSYDDKQTQDANKFAESYMASYYKNGKKSQIHLIATDGELYGHHKPWRDRFLTHLLQYSAPAFGFEVSSLGRYLAGHPATQEISLCEPSAWSCTHGVDRWSIGCACTEGDRGWKWELRQALNHLNEQGYQLFEQHMKPILHDPWKARNDYIALRSGWIAPEHYWAQHAKQGCNSQDIWLAGQLLETQWYHQLSFTSCGWFFEDIDRIEPRNDIAFAQRAVSLTWQTLGVDLQRGFVRELQNAKSGKTNQTGADLYHQVAPRAPGWLPQ